MRHDNPFIAEVCLITHKNNLFFTACNKEFLKFSSMAELIFYFQYSIFNSFVFLQHLKG